MTTHASTASESGARPMAAGAASSMARGLPWGWFGFGAVSLAAALVFWIFDALPFQDLPAHAGLIALRHRFGASPFEQRYFVFAPHIGPYSLFRFLGEELTRVLGPVGAVRALATLPVVATPLALLFARRRLHDDRSPAFGFLGLALSFGLMTLLGFASYLLGVAVLVAALTVWLELVAAVDRGEVTMRRELAMAAIAPLVFVAHGHAFVLFLVLAGVAAIATGDRWRRALRVRALVPAVALAAFVAWRERGTATPAGSVPVVGEGLAPHFQAASDKLSLLITPTLMTRTGVDFVVGVLVWIFTIAAAIATFRSLRAPAGASPEAHDLDARSRTHSRALYACVAVLTVGFLALPHAIGWFGFVDGRLVPLMLLLSLMAVRRPALGRALTIALDRGAPAAATLMAAVALVASHRFQEEAYGYKKVLAAVPENARLLNFPLDPNSSIFTAHPFIHYDKLVLAERPIVVSDVWFHQGSAVYPTPENPSLRLPASYTESDLRRIDWPSYKLSDWDYVLIRTRPDAPAPPVPSALALAEHQGGWWLYRPR
jgi:hypothetical protein